MTKKRGGAKSYEVSKFIAYSATIKRKRCAILRDEKSTIKDSIFNEISLRYETANEYGVFDPYYAKTDSEIIERRTRKSLVFTKGFRPSSNEKKANLKGISDIDIAVIEEAEDIRDSEKFSVFSDSIRKEGYLIIIVLNSPDTAHWIIKRYFNIIQAPIPPGKTEKEVDGFFQLVPKDIPGFVCIQTSYKDNPHLPSSKVSEYEGYGQEGHFLFDWHHYMTDILGYASHGRKGQVYSKVQPIKLQDYLALEIREIFGIDWGTNAPAAVAGAKLEKNNIYFRQLFYKPADVLELGKFFCTLQLSDNDIIIADSAGRYEISKFRNGWDASELSESDIKNFPGLLKGFNIIAVPKPPGSILSGISVLKAMSMFAVEEGTELWDEILNYVYSINKYGEYSDPIDNFNHLLDIIRYIAVSRGRFF